jgi:hypothetical protein
MIPCYDLKCNIEIKMLLWLLICIPIPPSQF